MSYRKMSERDVSTIVRFLEDFASDSNVLRWQDVEDFSKFTRQALSANSKIKMAYQSAKQRLADKRKSVTDQKLIYSAPDELLSELKRLKDHIAVLENQQLLWRRRWYCIAYHIRQQGIQMFNIDKAIPLGATPLRAKEVREVLEGFDQDIPPVMAHRDG